MRRVILAAVSTVAALVLLLSFKTHSTTSLATPPAAVASSTPSAAPSSAAPSASTAPATAAGSSAAPATSGSAPTTSASPTKKAATTTKAPTTKKTVTGDSEDTRYGPVQVQITVVAGKLTGVTAIDYPQNDPRDAQINAYAIPALDKEALAADNAKIDSISGATYTSVGYVSSLQSALDKAGL